MVKCRGRIETGTGPNQGKLAVIMVGMRTELHLQAQLLQRCRCPTWAGHAAAVACWT